MIIRRAAPLLAFLSVVPALACRESEARMIRADFGVVADTIPGGCERNACQFNAFGDAAFVSWFISGTGVASDTGGGGGGTQQFGNASVSRGGTLANPETFLSYNVVECGPFFCTSIAGGFGQIPNGDFNANGSTYRLTTNTADNPNFFTFVGQTGVVTIEWTGNGLFESHFNGSRQFTTPDSREHQAGQSMDKSATATGDVVGFSIAPGNSGSISRSHEVKITISR
jgi:hypothetical protein